jgi:excisionase family DNA binding protein
MAAEPEVLTVAEIAGLFRVSRMTVHRWIGSGDLVPLSLPGRTLRFRRTDVEALATPRTAAAS